MTPMPYPAAPGTYVPAPGYGSSQPGAQLGTGYYSYAPYVAYGPPSLPYTEGASAPTGYHLDSRPQKGLIIAGSVSFGVAYLSSLLAASGLQQDSSRAKDGGGAETLPLFIPVIGPFIGLATLDPDPVGSGWLVLDGLVQTGGVIMFVTGLVSPTKKFVRDDLAVRWTVSPVTVGRNAPGLGVSGTF
jgi:hypothetical protein